MSETRTCDACGCEMTEGYANEDGRHHMCERCFYPWMDEHCPEGWRANGHDDDPLWDGGYYDELIGGEWVDTGIFWTSWD